MSYHNPEGKVALKVGYARFFLCLFPGARKNDQGETMSEFIVTRVQEFAESLLPSMGLELVEVQFRQESQGWVLRLFIDGPEGVSLGQCTKVSRELSVFLDVEDLIAQAYTLEVSSPGLERPLRSCADFRRFVGKKARIKLRDMATEQKVFVGLIGSSDDKGVELLLEDGTSRYFLLEQIRKARLSL